MNKLSKNTIKIPLAIDGVIAVGFGLYSWFYPHQTFGTIISIPEAHSSAFLGILSSLSVFYILMGLSCFIGIKLSTPGNIWIGILMIIRHSLEGILKIIDMGKEWMIGNPYPDIIIHTVFITFYILANYFTYHKNQIVNELN